MYQLTLRFFSQNAAGRKRRRKAFMAGAYLILTTEICEWPWEHLAACYDRLAEQAERNKKFDLTYEPILRSGGGPV